MAHLLIVGLGTCGAAVAAEALAAGMHVSATSRDAQRQGPPGVRMVAFDAAGPAIAQADAVLATAPPGVDGDPVLARYTPDLGACHARLLYLSTTGVYGDRGGGWVDEDTPPAPTAARSHRRLAAELAWRALGRPLDIFRIAGIYGPGRSAFDELRSGRARRVIRPGHAFGRIHRDDIARAVLAALRRPAEPCRVFNLSDDEPAEQAEVIAHAATLLGLPLPPALPFDQAWAAMGDMARSFWADNRRVSAEATKAVLGPWRYPSYREGLAAILAEEAGRGLGQQGEVGRP